MAADDKLTVGDSTIEYDHVTYSLHVPKTADDPHGPFAVLVFFGGYGDTIEYYEKALAPMCDDLDVVLVVPQMPWFAKPGKASAAAVLGSLDGLRKEIEARFHTDPNLVIVSGASAGGGSACQLTRRWGERVPLLVLHSTNRCSAIGATRSILLVGEDEASFLGDGATNGKLLGEGLADLFAVPKESHGAHIPHMRWWMETELSALRLEKSEAVIELTQQEKPDAAAVLRSTKEAIRFLSTILPENDEFMKYQNARRKELLRKYGKQIEKLKSL